MTTMTKTSTDSKFDLLRILLHDAIHKNHCVLCGGRRHEQQQFCKQCLALCPNNVKYCEEISVQIKIRKD